MSRVIDGKDVLVHSSYLATVMVEKLGSFLETGDRGLLGEITLRETRKLFSLAMDSLRIERKETPLNHDPRDIVTTYQMLKGMLRIARPGLKDPDARLERLATAVEALSPGWEHFPVKREDYVALRDMFKEMMQEAGRYAPALGQHSPYSFGTFDDGDDD